MRTPFRSPRPLAFGVVLIAATAISSAQNAPTEASPKAVTNLTGQTVLDVATELVPILDRAAQLAKEGRIERAGVHWQQALNQAKGRLIHREAWNIETERSRYTIFRSVRGEIEHSLAKLPAEARGQLNPKLLAAFKDLRQTEPAEPAKAEPKPGEWTQWMGGPARNRVMPGPNIPPEVWRHNNAVAADAHPLRPIWTHHFADTETLLGGPKPEPDLSDDELRNNWQAFEWMPTAQLRFADQSVFFKTQNRTVRLGQADGELHWCSIASAFAANPATRRLMAFGRRGGMPEAPPVKGDEVQLFGDHVQSDLTVHGELVYTLEGQATSVAIGDPERTLDVWGRPFPRPGINETSRSRANRLCAYHRTTGKLRWSRWVDNERAEKSGAGFMSAPVPYGELLLVPVAKQNQLWLYALSGKDGRTLWTSLLCKDDNHPSRFSTVTLAVDAGTEAVYAATGAGVVIAADTRTGERRWAVAYERSVVQARRHGPFVVMPSDYTWMVAFDRDTGEHQWQSEQTDKTGDKPRSASYCLGLVDNKLFVAGKHNLHRYEMDGGRFRWSAHPRTSYGRGLLTKHHIFLPDGKRVLVFKTDATMHERRPFYFTPVLPHEDEVVGNLFSDGERLYITGTRCVSVYDARSVEATNKAP